MVHCEIGGTKTTSCNNTLLHPSVYLEYNAGDRPFFNVAKLFFSLVISDVYLGIPFEVLGIVNVVSYLVTNSAKYTQVSKISSCGRYRWYCASQSK